MHCARCLVTIIGPYSQLILYPTKHRVTLLPRILDRVSQEGGDGGHWPKVVVVNGEFDDTSRMSEISDEFEEAIRLILSQYHIYKNVILLNCLIVVHSGVRCSKDNSNSCI